MKIRTDFVTNSSSSSFSLILTVEGANGETVAFSDFLRGEDGGEARFAGDLRAICLPFSPVLIKEIERREYQILAENAAQEKRMKSVKAGDELDLAKDGPYFKQHNGSQIESYCVKVRKPAGVIGSLMGDTDQLIPLMNVCGSRVKAVVCGEPAAGACTVRILVHRDGQDPDQPVASDVSELAKLLMASAQNDYDRPNKKRKDNFVSAVSKTFASPDQIKTIRVEREYSAWGEFADLIAENDRTLRKLAENVVTCDDAQWPEALRAMREYVMTSNPDRAMNFGAGFDDFRYSCNTDDRSMLNLAMRLCMHEGPDSVSGHEFSEIDLPTGDSRACATFDLAPYTGDRGLWNVSVEDVRQQVLEERRMEEERKRKDKEAWLQLFGDVLTPEPDVVIRDRIFVFAGIYGGYYHQLVTEHGGIIRKAVSGKTNYLVVNPSGTYREGQIDKALEQQAKGKNVQIILPEELENALK